MHTSITARIDCFHFDRRLERIASELESTSEAREQRAKLLAHLTEQVPYLFVHNCLVTCDLRNYRSYLRKWRKNPEHEENVTVSQSS
jgi:hypothetical protein